MGTCFCQTARYKQHWVCFRCRKMFKKPAEADLPAEKRPDAYPCPECGEAMHNMGKEFEPPRQSDRKKWKAIEKHHRQIQAASMTIPEKDR